MRRLVNGIPEGDIDSLVAVRVHSFADRNCMVCLTHRLALACYYALDVTSLFGVGKLALSSHFVSSQGQPSTRFVKGVLSNHTRTRKLSSIGTNVHSVPQFLVVEDDTRALAISLANDVECVCCTKWRSYAIDATSLILVALFRNVNIRRTMWHERSYSTVNCTNGFNEYLNVFWAQALKLWRAQTLLTAGE